MPASHPVDELPAASLRGVSRRDFARLAGIGGLAALLDRPVDRPGVAPLSPTPASPDEAFWQTVRDQFLMPPDLTIVNAANLCPTSSPVVQAVYDATRDVDRDPSMPNRRKMSEGKEETRRRLAACLRVTPEDVVITRNTSEGNNFVSSGIDLKAGDEVLLSAENHPSLLAAWNEKAKRFGFTVRTVAQVNPHPGPEYYVDAFAKAITPRTRVIAFTHVTASAGDLYPAKELCRLARERGILSVVDAAQSFGFLDIDLSDMQPDFFTGSGHKWPCGPRECGVLYISKAAEPKIWPSVVSLYAGAVGVSKRFEGLGQRDEAGIIGFGEALALQARIGRKAIEERGRELAAALIAGFKAIDGVKIWTHPDPARSAAIVTILPGSLDPGKLAAALHEKDRIACTARDGAAQTASCTFRVTVAAPPRISATRFLAFGDSLTEGKYGARAWGLTFPGSYTLRLQELLAARYPAQSLMVINDGVGGESTATGVARLPGDIRTYAPAGLDVLLLWHGANDLGGGLPAIAPAMANLSAMIGIGRANGLRVLIATLPPRVPTGTHGGDAAIVAPFNDALRRLATADNVPLVDTYAAIGGDLSLVGPDGLHLTDEGYRVVAQAWFDAIKANFEVPTSGVLR